MSLQIDFPKKPGLFITGTDTGVGKTLIAGAIARILTEQGLKVGVFKPIATGCRHSREGLVSSDAEFLACCADCDYPLSVVNPVGYTTPAAPIVSADYEHRRIDFEEISSAYNYICQTCQMVIVEGIGGIRVPITEDIDLLDLAVRFQLPVVIVSRPGLGTINHTLLTIDAIRSKNLDIAGVVINGYDASKDEPAEITAPQVIARCGNVNILSVVPFDETVDVEQGRLGEVVIESLTDCNWAELAGL
jgi:dethiobiotin synthetase